MSTTHNPKAPHARRTSSDVEHPRDAFADRLRRLGAADDVVAAVIEHWDDPDWTERDEILGLSDASIAAELVGIEAEHYEGTHTEEEANADRLAAVELAARSMNAEAVPVVTAWVDGDPNPPERANATEIVESQREAGTKGPRKGVLEHVAAIIDASERG